MKIRQKSNRNNIICSFVGIGILFVSSIEMLLSIFCEKRKWPSQNPDLLFLLFGIVGLLLMFVGIVNIVSNIGINKYLKNPDYGLDYEKEYSTYRIIGKDKKKSKNGALKFQKYSEWKEHIEDTFKLIIDDEDAYRFMISRLRSRDNYKELLISAVIPVEVGMLTVFYSAGIDVSEMGTILSILVSAIVLLVIVIVNYLECKEEISFISDFIEIVFPSKIYLK